MPNDEINDFDSITGIDSDTDQVMTKNGKRMAILRPLDPALALRLVQEIPNGLPHEEAEKRFNAILDAQPYRFMGMAKKPAHGDQGAGIILDPITGKRIGRMQPGDSFVDYDVDAERESTRSRTNTIRSCRVVCAACVAQEAIPSL